MLEELTQEEETELFLKSYKERYNLFIKELTELFLKSCKEKYNLSEEKLKKLFPKLYKVKYNLSNKKLEKLFLEVYKERNLPKKELKKLCFKLYNENKNLFEEKLKESFLELYKGKYNLSEEALTKLFLELYKEKHNLSEEELLEYNTKKVEEIVVAAVYENLLPVVKYYIENGGNPYFVMEEWGKKFNIFNAAANKGCLDVINYLLDNNIFTVDQRASKNSATPFHSAVEGNNIEVAKLLLQKGADINAKFEYREKVETAWYFIFKFNSIEMAKFLLKNGIYIPDMSSDYVSKTEYCLLPIQELENLYSYSTGQDNDFINAYKTSTPEVQEIWDARISHLAEENSSIKIAGMSLDNNTAGDYS